MLFCLNLECLLFKIILKFAVRKNAFLFHHTFSMNRIHSLCLSVGLSCTGIALSAQAPYWERPVNPQDITIVRDSFGVPHVYGKTDADAAYGLAWAHCEDDFAGIQFPLMAFKYRLARVQGIEGAAFDVLAYVSQARQVIYSQYDTAFSEDFKRVLSGFTQGLNDYAATHWDQVIQKNIFPVENQEILMGYILGNTIMSNAAFDVGRIMDEYIRDFETDVLPNGSNAFAVSRRITHEKKTFLVSNSHQPLEGPLAWYEVHVNSEEGWNFLGATFSMGMTPFVGTNPYLGWTHTTNQPDVNDVYKLRMHPSKKLHYAFDGEWLPLERCPLRFRVKVIGIRFPVTLRFFRSRHGMVIKNKDGFYALRFSANMRVKAAEQWYRMNKARNFEEFKAAIDLHAIPCQNVVYADREDNIYFLSNALIPRKRDPNYNWRRVLPGDTSSVLWPDNDFFSVDELPQLLNPKAGYLYNANNTPFSATHPSENLRPEQFPNHIMGHNTKETNRSIRIMELMHERERLGYESLRRIKYDTKFSDSTFYTYTLQNLDMFTQLDPDKYPDIREVIEMVRTWDRCTDKNNPQGAVLSVAITYLIDYLEERSNLLGENTLPEAVFVDAVRRAKKFLLKHYGRLDVPLGTIQRHRREKDDLGVSFPMSGMPENLAAMIYKRDDKKGILRTYAGESFILIAQYGEQGVEKLETIVPFGASSDPKNPHYNDQMEMYVRQELKPMSLDRNEVFQTAKSIYQPQPNMEYKNYKKKFARAMSYSF